MTMILTVSHLQFKKVLNEELLCFARCLRSFYMHDP